MQAGDMAEPTVRDHDVLVEIHAAGVNQLAAKIRDGEFKLILGGVRIRDALVTRRLRSRG
jgi:NADPH:quinone reductase-like Zn-dependent oxidoreductase